jgi:5-methylcytosine-specific restriction endonuclease McrA
MTKKEIRTIVFNKCNGRCAYCGEILENGWHIDELLPVRRKYKTVYAHWKNKITGEKSPILQENMKRFDWEYMPNKTVSNGYENPENFNIDNQMPSCPSCNINKHSDSLENFRSLIQGFMKHLNEHNTQYKIAKRYGLVKEDIKPIIFYFEKISK